MNSYMSAHLRPPAEGLKQLVPVWREMGSGGLSRPELSTGTALNVLKYFLIVQFL
jgi:hypothetical protein